MDPNSILITNSYSWYNKGDAVIIIATIKALRRLWPKARIAILSMTPEVSRPHYRQLKAEVFPQFFGDVLNPNRSKILKMTKILATTINVAFLITFRQILNKLRIKPGEYHTLTEGIILKQYFDADIVISSGGGFLNDDHGSIFLLHLYQILVSLLLRKPTIICAQSIGPFKNKLHSFLAKLTLNKVDLITLREDISSKLLSELRIATNVCVTADMSFALFPEVRNEDTQLFNLHRSMSKKKTPIIGVSVRKWIYPKFSSPDEKHNRYVETFANFVDYLANHLNATVVFIPEVIGPYEDDQLVARCILSKVRNKESVNILTADYSPFELIQIMRGMDFFIGTRMHSNILALLAGVPIIAISYGHKTDGIMKMCDLADNVIPINTLSLQDLITKMGEMWPKREELKNGLDETLSFMYDRAMLNVKLIRDLPKAKRASVPN